MSAVLPASAMRRVTCAELKNLAAAYRPALYYAAAQCARETKIYLHWTAGHYGQFFADYHVQIDADGGIYVIGGGALDMRAMGPRVPRHAREPRVQSVGVGRHARRRCPARQGAVVSGAQIDCPARAERILIYDHGIPQIPIDSIKMTVSHIMSANMTGGHFIGEIKGLSWNKQNTGIPSSSY